MKNEMIRAMRFFKYCSFNHLICCSAIILLSGCNTNLDYSQLLDLPESLYKSINSKDPAPKETGIIVFETYAIVRAKKGERVFNVADRINVSSKQLAVHNGLSENYQLSQGEILAIPLGALPNKNDNSVNIAKVASTAINRVKTQQETQVTEEVEETNQNNINKAKDINKATNKIVESEMTVKTYMKPIEGEISNPFSYETNGNQGINIKAPEGAAIMATNDGTIVLVSRGENQPTVVLIRHNNEILSAYSNISEVNLSKGDKVLRGQIIGVVSTGADYVHFEIIKGTERIDPIKFFKSN